MDYVKIGNVTIKRTAALAPMASVADYAFRAMAKEYGAAYVVGEMASAKGLCFSDRKTAELLTVTEGERPMAVQLFGCEPYYMAKAAEITTKYAPDIIDINAGCPVPKVAGNGCGSALMKTPELLGEVVRAAVNAVDIPVTVKIRSGWDRDSINAVEIAKIAEQSGAAALTVHARTRDQMYSGKADRDVIRRVKNAVSIPVIGNGDIDSGESALAMYKETGCDLVMVGRAAMGRPWIFAEIEAYLNNEAYIPPTPAEKAGIMKRHILLLAQSKGERVGMKEARSAAAHYLKGFQQAARLRGLCGTMSTLDDFLRLYDEVMGLLSTPDDSGQYTKEV